MICSAHFLIKPRIRLGAPAFAPAGGGEGVGKEARDANEGMGEVAARRGGAGVL